MRQSIRWAGLLMLGLLLNVPLAYGQDFEEIGGPYEPDEHTVLLMHFDGDISVDITDYEIGDPVGFGKLGQVNSSDFINDSRLGDLGQQIYIDNLSSADSTYLIVPDTTALDLKESWTIEFWANVISFGTSSESHTFEPRVLTKRGPVDGEEFDEANFWNNFQGGSQAFNTGYAAPGPNHNQVSPPGLIEPNNWYHVTFVRDLEKEFVAQLIHQLNTTTGELELTFFGAQSISNNLADPYQNSGHVYIGGLPIINANTTWFNGFLDEIRISNVARDFEAPPIVQAQVLPVQEPGSGPWTVEASVQTLGQGQAQDVTLHYDTGSGFETTPMTLQGDTAYVGDIPSQPIGTTIRYYVSGRSGDLTATDPQKDLEAEMPENFYQFAVVAAESQVLHLTFEEGTEGDVVAPVDYSDVGHQVQVFGSPRYSTDAAEGDYSVEFSAGDSSYLMIDPAPALATEEFLLDFWFNVDSVTTGGRYIVKENGEADEGPVQWINYKVFTFSADQTLRAASYQKGGGLNGGQLDPEVVPDLDTWYHASYFMSSDTAYFQVRHEDGSVAFEAGYSGDALPATATSGPFYVGFSTEPGADFFIGKMDDIRLFNYPKQPEGTSITGVTTLVGTYAPDAGPYEVQATVSGEQAITDAAIHYRVDGGDFQSVAMTDAGGGTFAGGIPAQEAGSVVEYYVAVEDAGGVRLTNPAQAESDDPRYYHFGVGETQGMMLHLTFEEGEGTPQNHGLYEMPIELGGINATPSYSDDAAVGNHALRFTREDSSYLRIHPASFLASEEFLIDFWFKPDSVMGTNEYLVTKSGGAGITSQPNQINYKVFTLNGEFRSASYQRGGGLNGGNLDTNTPPEVGVWYRAVYYMSADTAYTVFHTADGEVVHSAGYSSDALPATATYGPFFLGFSDEPPANYYEGLIDDVKFYNYAKEPENVPVSDEPVASLPGQFELDQNYPNPFSRQTTIAYALPEASDVRLDVYDVLGRRVATLAEGRKAAGRYKATMNTHNLSSGLYFYRLEAGETVISRKMLLVQ